MRGRVWRKRKKARREREREGKRRVHMVGGSGMRELVDLG
jgi:hypothetical protein